MQTYDLTLKDLLMGGAPVLLKQAAGIAEVRLAPLEVPVIGGRRLDLFGEIDGDTALHTEIPLNTNTDEGQIRAFVTKRKVSGGTRGDIGRQTRDTFLGLAKTCAKLGLSFWGYLGDRFGITPGTIPPLANIIRQRAEEYCRFILRPAPT